MRPERVRRCADHAQGAVVGVALAVVVVGLAVVGADALLGRQMVRPGYRPVDVLAPLTASRSPTETLTLSAMRIQ